MCLAIPVKVIKINGEKAIVDADGLQKEISIMLLPQIKVGDYVLLHSGFAIKRVDLEEAKETLKLVEEIINSESKK